MREAISAAILTELSCELGNEELGAAIRLISRLCETKRPVSLRTAHISAGMDKGTWNEISSAVLAFFEVDENALDLPQTVLSEVDDDTTMLSLKSTQNELNLMVRPARRPTVPQYATAEKPPAISIRQALYDQAVRLFTDAGMAEKTARSILASMLKNYPEGDVAMAVSDAARKDALAEPHTWILGRLKAESRKRNAGSSNMPKPANPDRIVTPERAGISAARAEKIRARNRALSMNVDTTQ